MCLSPQQQLKAGLDRLPAEFDAHLFRHVVEELVSAVKPGNDDH